MKTFAGFLLLAASVSSVLAQSAISPGGTAVLALPATTSIYEVFGVNGSTNDESSPAPYVTFAASASNVFSLGSASGTTNCCGGGGGFVGSDGGTFFGGGITNVAAFNGLSGVSGNSTMGLLGVFTDENNPTGGVSPSPLAGWDKVNPLSLAPQLLQVFYIGDGRAGFENSAGSLLSFSAPSTATRLYLGFADGSGFIGVSSFYADNLGGLTGTVALNVPEPETWMLMLFGLCAVCLARRRLG